MNRRPVAILALLVFLGSLAIYAWGAAPTVLDRDSAELQTVALTRGIAHTTGYPTFAMVGWLFGKILGGDPAHRINLMSAFFAAVSLSLIVLLAWELGLGLAVGFAAALILGSTFTFWAFALRAEVYALSMAVFLAAVWRTLVARRTGRLSDAIAASVLLGLSLTGQLSCLPIAAALGLSLVWDAWKRRKKVLLHWLLLALGLFAGLTPYLHIVWADSHGTPMNYLRHVDRVFFPATGVPSQGFDSPWERLRWLVLGGNMPLGQSFSVGWKHFLRSAVDGGMMIVLFEFGLIAALLFPVGFRSLLRQRRGEMWLLAGVIAMSMAFSAATTSVSMFSIFLLFVTALASLVVAKGLEWVVKCWPGINKTRPGSAPWVVFAAVLIMIPPHLMRIQSYSRPIGPRHSAVLEEDATRPLYLLPRRHDPYSARRFGEGAMREIPRDAMVVGEWRELPILYYFRYVEGARPDLTFQPYSYPEVLEAMKSWQDAHEIAARPAVFLTLPVKMRQWIPAPDSLEVDHGKWVYVVRRPLERSGNNALGVRLDGRRL